MSSSQLKQTENLQLWIITLTLGDVFTCLRVYEVFTSFAKKPHTFNQHCPFSLFQLISALVRKAFTVFIIILTKCRFCHNSCDVYWYYLMKRGPVSWKAFEDHKIHIEDQWPTNVYVKTHFHLCSLDKLQTCLTVEQTQNEFISYYVICELMQFTVMSKFMLKDKTNRILKETKSVWTVLIRTRTVTIHKNCQWKNILSLFK